MHTNMRNYTIIHRQTHTKTHTTQVRGALGVPMTAASIFQSRTIATLARNADAMGARCPAGYKAAAAQPPKGPTGMDAPLRQDKSDLHGGKVDSALGGRQTSLAAMLVQALPLTVMYPLRRIATWLVFVSLWLFLQVVFSSSFCA
jgi:hypothetical protein